MFDVDHSAKCLVCGGVHAVGIQCPKMVIDITKGIDEFQGQSYKRCSFCKEVHSTFVECSKRPLVAPKEVYVPTKEPLTIDSLYKELGTADWIGYSDSDWNEAIDAVRRYIRNNR